MKHFREFEKFFSENLEKDGYENHILNEEPIHTSSKWRSGQWSPGSFIDGTWNDFVTAEQLNDYSKYLKGQLEVVPITPMGISGHSGTSGSMGISGTSGRGVPTGSSANIGYSHHEAHGTHKIPEEKPINQKPLNHGTHRMPEEKLITHKKEKTNKPLRGNKFDYFNNQSNYYLLE